MKKVIILTLQQSIVINAIVSYLRKIGYETDVTENIYGSIEENKDSKTVFLLYISENTIDEIGKMKLVSSMSDTLNSLGKKMILIGEEAQKEVLISRIPEMKNYVWCSRPVDMDILSYEVNKKFATKFGKKRILIVDDDPTYAKMVRSWISDEYSTNIVTAGLQAVSYLMKNSIDLVLLDYEMPMFDGARTLKMIRSNPVIKDMPIVFLTGNNSKEEIMKIIELNPAGYILKSAHKDELLERIAGVFDKVSCISQFLIYQKERINIMKFKKIIQKIFMIYAIVLTPILNTAVYAEEIPEWAQRAEDRIYTFADDAEEDIVPIYENIPVERFSATNLSPLVSTEFDYTDWQYNEWEDCRYLYLPTTANRNDLKIIYKAKDYIYLNGKKLISGESISLTENEYNITVGGTKCGKLKVMQSNLGCIYLSTSTGGLDALDNNGNLLEKGKAFMLDANGNVRYDGEVEKITSHGNSSWGYSKKKPYNFKLPQKADLYGMGKAKKWMLIANYLDHSMMRNYFTMELSKMTGMEYIIDSTFVDLYADGSYRGTYQLCERIQIQKKRLDIRDLEEDTEKLNNKELEEYPRIAVNANGVGDYKVNSYKYYDIPNEPKDITGGYLLQFQQANRYGYKAESGFVTSRGQAVQIDGPEIASKKQELYIRHLMQ